MHTKTMWTAAALAVAAAACGSEADPEAALYGAWERGVGFPTAESYAFDDDGTFVFETPVNSTTNNVTSGTWSATEDVLTLDGVRESDGMTLHAEWTYYADDTRVVTDALLAVGDHDGPVGTWKGRFVTTYDIPGMPISEFDERLEIELRADGTGQRRDFGRNETIRRDGTWIEDDRGILFEYFDPIANETFDLRVEVAGDSLGREIFYRVR